MKCVDEERWRAQQAELSATDEGKAFLAFLQEWVARAEQVMAYCVSSYDNSPLINPVEALRRVFESTEEKFGQIPGVWLGQMLLVIVGNWVHGGKDLVDAMTCFERRIVEEAQARQIYELQEAAAQAGGSLPDYLQVVPTE